MRNQFVAVFGALALAACSQEGPGVAPDNGGGAGHAKSNVTVTDPGAEPRALLAYQIAPHSKESFAVTTAFAGKLNGDKTVIPTMEMDGDVIYADRDKNGGLPFTFTTTKLAYQDTPGSEVPASAMNAQLKGVTMTVTGTLAPNGSISGLKLKVDGANEALQHGLENLESTYAEMVPELPDVPVGRGAHWQRVVKVADNGVDADQTMDFTLVDVQGSHVVLKTAIKIAGKPQHIEKTGAELKKFAGEGTYDATLDLAHMIGATVMNVHVEGELVAMGQTVTQAMDSAVTTAPKTPDSPK
jgi:hypothetical protein